MKTIATAAVLIMLAVPTWADEAENKEANELTTTNEPIVLSEAEMDGVTAGVINLSFGLMNCDPASSRSSAQVHSSGGYFMWAPGSYTTN